MDNNLFKSNYFFIHTLVLIQKIHCLFKFFCVCCTYSEIKCTY
ncbi:hypothetical protein FM106_27325 [Brachybacterium faecium]|nr:hypothetical protein FM106_27325 [Brachybacterium faecium]